MVLPNAATPLEGTGERIEQMKRMTNEIRDRISSNLADARVCRRQGEWGRCWGLLEDAHVLSQPWAIPHIRVHAAMLVAGWKLRDVVEVRGQVLRLLVGGPASAIRRYPVGNTGRARVSAIQPMPVRTDLATMLEEAGQRTGSLTRVDL